MKEFSFDDIEIIDDEEKPVDIEVNEAKDIFGDVAINSPKAIKEEIKPEPLYKKFSFDISLDENSNKPEAEVDTSFGDSLFESDSKEIDNPFVKKEEEEQISMEEQVHNMYKEAIENAEPILNDIEQDTVNIESVVDSVEANIESKEDALETALSHTTKFSPFAQEKPSVAEIEVEEKKPNSKSSIIFLVVLFLILLIAIFVIPKIASLI